MGSTSDLKTIVAEAANHVKAARTGFAPTVGIILGTGLGGLSAEIEDAQKIPYQEIPNFPVSTVESHSGDLVLGTVKGKSVVAMEGRFHYYEGYSMKEITLPVRVMKALGCETLIVSNACGGMNPMHGSGDIVVIEDQINFMGDNPLFGPNDETMGPRFPDMCAPFDAELIDLALKIALENNIVAHRGVYVAVAGPNLETRAEYRMLRGWGADVVGMSTVPEVIVAVHSGMRVMGLSVITDLCLPDSLKPAAIEDIIAVANEAEPKLTTIVTGVLERL